jgi:hypothetical protein
MVGEASGLSIDHFLCYDVSCSKGEPGLAPLEVLLGDQFGEAQRLLAKPKQLCTPVDKNAEGVHNEETHLTCYEVKKLDNAHPVIELKLDVPVANQFGNDQAFTLKKPKTVCLPSIKEVLD